MSDTTINEQIKKLIALQEIDREIYEIRQQLKENPIYLNEMKQNFEDKKADLNELEEKLKKMQVARKTLEGDLQAQEELIAKANAQLSQIKTNKEYTAKLTEIESIKADKSRSEEKILESYDDADIVKESMSKEKEVLTEEEKKYNEQKKKVDASITTLENRIKELEGQRVSIAPEVEKEILGRYEKILVNKEGLALVPVKGSACGGCYMNVPAQILNEIKMSNKLA